MIRSGSNWRRSEESCRAGRDGLSAECILLFQLKDCGLQSFFMAGRYPTLDDFPRRHRSPMEQSISAGRDAARSRDLSATSTVQAIRTSASSVRRAVRRLTTTLSTSRRMPPSGSERGRSCGTKVAVSRDRGSSYATMAARQRVGWSAAKRWACAAQTRAKRGNGQARFRDVSGLLGGEELSLRVHLLPAARLYPE